MSAHARKEREVSEKPDARGRSLRAPNGAAPHPLASISGVDMPIIYRNPLISRPISPYATTTIRDRPRPFTPGPPEEAPPSDSHSLEGFFILGDTSRYRRLSARCTRWQGEWTGGSAKQSFGASVATTPSSSADSSPYVRWSAINTGMNDRYTREDQYPHPTRSKERHVPRALPLTSKRGHGLAESTSPEPCPGEGRLR